jgi:S-adenosylmethionine:tRNA ribosyltransferase-isomerase
MMDLNLDLYKYDLPESKIARFPLPHRDHSKLLFYNKGQISHHRFSEIESLFPRKSLLVFNETKVIPARLRFQKSTGAVIEVMLLHPVAPSSEINLAMGTTGKVTWKCMIRNLRRWNPDDILKSTITVEKDAIKLYSRLVDKEEKLVEFMWHNDRYTFSDVLNFSGKVPLPPYLKREPVPLDKTRYQTIYSKNDGAVAAPTAGLHFTRKILRDINTKGHITDFLTLHVSAGTFRPIQVNDIRKHDMHRESILVKRSNVLNLINNIGRTIAIGTTSMRTLESLYWFGVKIIQEHQERLFIEKLYPYPHDNDDLPSTKDALMAVCNLMEEKKIEEIHGETEIFLFPGYRFKVCNGLVTNYHMPASTLMLLVAAFVGNDWKKIYDEALSEDYRFLSYGDSSFLIPGD